MRKIEVKIPAKEYSVMIDTHSFDRLEKIIKSKKLYTNIFLVVDKNVLELHRSKIIRFVSNFPGKYFIHEFDADELNKNISSAEKIFANLISNGFGRDTLLIAIGGGITGDLAGFTASTFARGIQLIQIPTTLVAAVDSSVGGKTGINFGDTKNIVGSFYQPEFVLIDTDFLKTLPEEEIICGLGEIIKYAFLTDQKFFIAVKNNFQKLLKQDSSLILKIIETCVSYKRDIVTRDEKESGLRKVLNLGHTFAHALEVEQEHNIKHGKAVIAGLACALDLSRRTGVLNSKNFDEYVKLPQLFADKIKLEKYDIQNIYESMKRDKKSRNYKMKFILMKSIGNILVDVEAEENEVKNSIQQGLSIFKK